MIVETSIGIGEHGVGQIVQLPLESLSLQDRLRIFDDFSQGEDARTRYELLPEEARLLLTELKSIYKLPEGDFLVKVANSRRSSNQTARHGLESIKLQLDTSKSTDPKLVAKNFENVGKFPPEEFLPVFKQVFFSS